MLKNTLFAPAPIRDGRIPTLNLRGFTTEVPDPISEEFVQFAAETDSEVLDMGCAYGVSAIRALRAGAKVCACDMDQRHLDILSGSVKSKEKGRLRCELGYLPDVDFPVSSFRAVLCSRVLHFLKGSDVVRAVEKMYRWLQPGGKVFIIVDTPNAGILRSSIPEYQRKKALNDPWPGFIPNQAKYLPPDMDMKFDPEFIHPMDPDIIARVCREAGFLVEKSEFMARVVKTSRADPRGRDHAALVARKCTE